MGIGNTLGTIGGLTAGAATVATGAPVISAALVGIAETIGIGAGAAATVGGWLTAANTALATATPALGVLGAEGAVGAWLSSLTAVTTTTSIITPLGLAPIAVTGTTFGAVSGLFVGLGAAAPIAAAALLTVGVIAAAVLVNKVAQFAGNSLDNAGAGAKHKIQTQRTQQRQQSLQKQHQKQRTKQLQQETKLAKKQVHHERQTQKEYSNIANEYKQVKTEQQKTHAAREQAVAAKEQSTSHVETEMTRRDNKPDVTQHMPFV